MTSAFDQVAEAIRTHGVPKYLVVVPRSVRTQLTGAQKRELLTDAPMTEGWVRQGDRVFCGRIDAREALRIWATQNLYAVLTVKEIADAADVPQSAVRQMISDRPDILRKSDGRTYEVRDPNADRAAQKVK